MFNTSAQSVITDDHAPTTDSAPADSDTSVPQNRLPLNGCIEMVFNEEYVPWNNPSNIVTREVEMLVSQIKNTVMVFLFLIGGPGNVINMVVFYKQGLQDRVNLCLFALALADEINLIFRVVGNGERLYLQYATGETDGPITRLLLANYFRVFYGFTYISSILSAIIACERCYCVLRPHKYQTLMRTRTMAAIIVADYFLIIGLFFFVYGFRYRYACVYDPVSGATREITVLTDFYKQNKAIHDFLFGAFIGVGLSAVVVTVVIVATMITAVKLHQIVTWRAETSVSITSREINLTKMLIGTSILFVVCIFPTALLRFMASVFPEINPGRRNHNFFHLCASISQLSMLINCSFNIAVYYVMGSRYRETFWSLFGRQIQYVKPVSNISVSTKDEE